MDVACVASSESFDLVHENKAAASGDMEDLPAHAYVLWVEREGSAKFDLIERLCGWPERFVNLPYFYVSDIVLKGK